MRTIYSTIYLVSLDRIDLREKEELIDQDREIRIHILGGPGSGKTSFARYLSARFSVPLYDLDQLGHGNRTADYVDDAFSIAEQPRWVTEGIYLIWTDPLLYRANYIVLLDVPWPTAAWRILRRHIRRSLHGTNPYPGMNGVRLLLKLLQFARPYYTERAGSPHTAATLREYFEEDTESNQPPRAEVLLGRFEAHMQAIPFTSEYVRLYLEKYRDKVYVIKDKEGKKRLIDLIKRGDPEGKTSVRN